MMCLVLEGEDDDDSYGFSASLRSLLHLGFSWCLYVLFLHMFQSLPSYPPTMHSYVCVCVCAFAVTQSSKGYIITCQLKPFHTGFSFYFIFVEVPVLVGLIM